MPVFDPDHDNTTNERHYRMRYSPKSEQELADESMLPDGTYDFSVDSAKDAVSKTSGADMIALGLTVFAPNGGERRVKDWLMEKVAFKLRHFCYAVGYGSQYESGNINANELVGRSGKLILKKGKPNGDFAPRNEVKDYVTAEKSEVKLAANASPKVPTPVEDDVNSPPF